jgi:hypothetical protein
VPGTSPSGSSVVLDPGSLGYGSGLSDSDDGLPSSVAVEFDTHFDESLGDPVQEHVSVHSRGTLPNSANETFRVGDLSNPALVPRTMRRKLQTATLTFKNGILEVILDPFSRPALQTKLDLVGELEGVSEVYVGVSASLSDGSQDSHTLVQWSFAYTGNVLSAANSRVYGPGWTTSEVVAGIQMNFSIAAMDIYNHPYFGGALVFYALIGDVSVPAVPLQNDPSTLAKRKKANVWIYFFVG